MIPPDSNNLEAEVSALKNQVFTLLVALIVVSGTLTVFLYREASLAGKDIVQEQKLADLVGKNQVAIDGFVSRLIDYSHRHPDFAPVLKKYGIGQQPAAPGAAPAAPKK